MIRETILAIIIAFAVSALLCPVIIPFLHKLKFGQQVRDDGPQSHLKKQGTPTMGGLIILTSIIITSVFYIPSYPRIIPVLFMTVGFGVVGFLDDYIKIVMKRSEGLNPIQKLIGQFVITGIFAYYIVTSPDIGTGMLIPFTGKYLQLPVWLFVPALFFIILGTDNGVNFTDGLDGLCSCVTFVSMLGYLLAASMLSFYHVAVLAAATAAAAAGFLVWNFYPAKVFMGDTGSMFLGGMVTALAFIMGRPELVFFFGIVYIWDAMTVVIQRVYFKATHGKRLFKMAPIHHAFEMRGWKEVKIDFFFSLIAIIGVVLGLMYVYMA